MKEQKFIPKNNQGVSSYTHTKQQRDYYANQHNLNNAAHQLNPNDSNY
ncbi:MAG: hypothetical protein K2I42_00840 [Anaeroplasmataceae bacterium]|nr:hypothetical protein [Anaeroplasmataceae bacterium]